MDIEPTRELSTLDEILAEEGFIRSLALKLVRDDELANDVFQETLLAALRRPRKSNAPLRSWLARVVHNRVAQNHRERLRRERHEALVDPTRDDCSPFELAEREGVRAHVVRAVEALNEPYRSAIVLRFYENLEPREIAERLGIPAETARTRVKRGIAFLRARLDREYGGDSARWAFALANWIPRAPLAAPIASGARIARWCAGLIIVIVGVAWLWFAATRNASPGGSAVADLGAEAPAPSSAPAAQASADSREASAAVPSLDELAVRVVGDDDRAPLAGAVLEFARLDGKRAKWVADSTGAVHFAWPRDRTLEIDVAETDSTLARHATLSSDARRANESLWTVEVERASSIAGRTIDRFGEAVVGARVRILARDTDDLLAEATSDLHGVFHLARLPHKFRATVASDERVASEQMIAELPRAVAIEKLELVLEDPAPTAGRVVDPDGHGVANVELALSRIRGDADVRAGSEPGTWFVAAADFVATTDADGRFDLNALPHGRYRLDAKKSGFANFSRTLIAGDRELAIELEAGLEFVAEIVDSNGRPIGGAAVEARIAADGRNGTTNFTSDATSDASGRAKVDGCASGASAWVRASAPGYAARLADAFELDALGSPERITLDAGRELSGTVADASGQPLAGAKISARAVVSKELCESFGLGWHNDLCELARTTTKSDGSFSFGAIARSELELEVCETDVSPPIHIEAIDANSTQVDIRIDAPHGSVRLAGKVHDGWNGEAPREFTVTAMPDDVEARTSRVSQHVVDGSGRFALDLGRRGDWLLCVSSPGYASLALPMPHVKSEHEPLDLALYPERDFAVRVVDRHGTPVPFATIAIADRDEQPLPVAVRDREWRSAVQVGARGDATLRGLPATLVRLHVTTPFVREPHDFEFELRTPIAGVQELQLAEVEVDAPRRALSLELLEAADANGARLELDGAEPDHPTAFEGHVRFRVLDVLDRAVLSFAGTVEDGRLRSDPNRRVLYVLTSEGGGVHYAWMQELRANWGAAFGRDFFPTGDVLRALPIVAGECRVEVEFDGREPLSLTIPASTRGENHRHDLRAFAVERPH